MGAQLRVYRRRIRSVNATKKITRAMELIAASRIVKARARVDAVASVRRRAAQGARPRPRPRPASTTRCSPRVSNPQRAAVLLLTSRPRFGRRATPRTRSRRPRRSASCSREGNTEVVTLHRRSQGRELLPLPQPCRSRASGPGFSENPTYADAREIADVAHRGVPHAGRGGRRRRDPRRLHPLPLDGHAGGERAAHPPVRRRRGGRGRRGRDRGPRALRLRAVGRGRARRAAPAVRRPPRSTPRCSTSAASEHAARQRAMKSATDNAEDLVKDVHPQGERGPSGRDHPGNQRDRRRRRRVGISNRRK